MTVTTLAVLGALASVPVFAQMTSVPLTPDTPSKAAFLRDHGLVRDLVHHNDGTDTSSNWSGYAVTGTGFTNATASWIVPKLTCKSGVQYSAFWVGIDGFSDKTVEQTGTEGVCVGSTPQYSAWYEFCCVEPIETISGMAVAPGDKMSASIVYKGTKFTATITNETTGKTYSKTRAYKRAKRTSAEWIAEAPEVGGGIAPLANFGTVLFGDDSTGIGGTCDAQDSASSGPIGNFSTIEEITMATKSEKEAIPSALSSDGTSFSVTWAAP